MHGDIFALVKSAKKIRQNRLTHLCISVVNRLGNSSSLQWHIARLVTLTPRQRRSESRWNETTSLWTWVYWVTFEQRSIHIGLHGYRQLNAFEKWVWNPCSVISSKYMVNNSVQLPLLVSWMWTLPNVKSIIGNSCISDWVFWENKNQKSHCSLFCCLYVRNWSTATLQI